MNFGTDYSRMPDNLLGELIILAVEGKATPAEFQLMQEYIQNDPAAAEYYYEFLTTYIAFSSYGTSGLAALWSEDKDADLLNLLHNLADDQESAPPIELPEPQPVPARLPEPIKIVPGKRNVGLYVSLATVAALAIFAICLEFLPQKETGRQVATLTDTVRARWAKGNYQVHDGMRLKTASAPFTLEQGYAQLLFDNQTVVTLEGPAEFQILTNNQIQLNYGRLYASVPPQAYGFTVNTEFSKVIDLGTEFGVHERRDGHTEVHVIKGKTNLVASNQGNNVSMEINAGNGRSFRHADGIIEEVPCKTDLFARHIDSNIGFVWNGQTRFDLADVVGGGNGFGSGLIDYGITMRTGQGSQFNDTSEMYGLDNRYVLAAGNPYVDGVFVPNGEYDKVVVSSTGLSCSHLPETNGGTWGNVFNGAFHISGNVPKHALKIDGREYGYSEDTKAICMHSNKGITFDLNAIRNDIPGLEITKFDTGVALSETSRIYKGMDSDWNTAEFFVLIDGELKVNTEKFSARDGLRAVEVAIEPTDRFLTLVMTDGDLDVSYDWCFLIKPELTLEQK